MSLRLVREDFVLSETELDQSQRSVGAWIAVTFRDDNGNEYECRKSIRCRLRKRAKAEGRGE